MVDSFAILYRSHEARVRAVCLRICQHAALADDAVQETFLEVHRNLGSFRHEASLSTWIHRIAVRTAIRVSRSTRPGWLPLEAVDGTHGAIEPHPRLVARAQARATLAAMAELPDEQRTVLALTVFDELGQVEIATMLGVPQGTVWSRLHLARRRLAAAIE